MTARLERLRRRLGLTDASKDALLTDLLEDAGAAALAYTGRRELPEALESAVVEIAAGQYHTLGLEGSAAYSEGGVSATRDLLPAHIKSQLNAYRVAKMG